MSANNFSKTYLLESIDALNSFNESDIESLAFELAKVKQNAGRLFILGVGGSAGTASHAVNDFRKICNIEAYTPTDNASELTARINDDGWETSFVNWLKGSRLKNTDGILVLSVGGGNSEKNVSMNLVKSVDYAKSIGCSVMGVVGRDGGYTKQKADACVIVPTVSPDRITPHTEGLCSVILHLIVSHPALKVEQTKWESVK